jgi:bifunctional UDP-N-acetylglucosamine pyrophosphorylase/glucosamine-1-phosphate N-acetyltransferase
MTQPSSVQRPAAQAPIAIVLAAGQGTRMKSALPKVLHPLLGRPMVTYPVQAALDAGAAQVVVVLGHGREQVAPVLTERFGERVVFAHQERQLGTGDAARVGAAAVPHHTGTFLVLYGDAAAITSECLTALHKRHDGSSALLSLLTVKSGDATGYGRIIRDPDGTPVDIREQRDCSPEEAAIREWNPGVYAVNARFFRDAIAQLNTKNAQGELYLTDLVALAAQKSVVADVTWPEEDLHGVNDRYELSQREQVMRLRFMRKLARSGVTIRDAGSTFIDADCEIAPDVTIEAGVHLRGACAIESGAVIDTGCVLRNVKVCAGAKLLPYTIATDSAIGERAQVGPFSHLRPSSELGPESHVGNFVETKKTRLGKGSKANHLAYLGDSEIGQNVNVGAGTIFCNYDGFAKHLTVLEDNAFIGSDSQLVAPVTVGKDGYVATGTTVTMDVPAGALAIGRTKQVNKDGLGIRLREKLKAQAAAKKK